MHFSNNIQNFYHIKYDVGKEEKTKKMKERRTEKKVNYGHKISFLLPILCAKDYFFFKLIN